MITINLLPDEFRKKSRTPVKLLLGMAASVAVLTSLFSWWAWLTFGVQNELGSERDTLAVEMDGIDPQVAYHKQLDVEKSRYAERETALGQITRDRINWTRKVDQLIDVIHSGGEGERHYVWLDDLNIEQRRDPRSNSFGSFKANGHSGSDNFAQVANFLEDIETSAFVEDFYAPAPPEGTQKAKDEDLIPSEVWAFPLQLDLRSPEERKESAEQ